MALNVAVPLSGITDLFEGCGLLSPISPISFGSENIQLRISPDFAGNDTNLTEQKGEKYKNDLTVPVTSTPTPFNSGYDMQPILYNGRNILELADNIKSNSWNFQFAYLPSNNLQMFLKNRSQYHRLGTNGHIQDYMLAKCSYCTFKYPTTIQNNNSNWNSMNCQERKSSTKVTTNINNNNNHHSFPKMYKNY